MNQEAAQIHPYRIVNDGTSRSDWLNSRHIGIGASEVPILFDLVIWGDPLTLYAEKRGEMSHEEPADRQILDWGTDCQESIIRYLHRQTGEKIDSNQALFQSIEYPWLVCTPDAIVDPLGAEEPCEVKVQTFGYNESEWTDGIPEKFRVQCQTQMIVTQKPRCLFGASIWGKSPIWCWYPWDDVLARQIIHKTKRFWDQVKAGTPPESNGSEMARKTAFALANREPETVELYTGEIEGLLDAWNHAHEVESRAKAEAKLYEKKRKASEDALILKMGSAERAITSDGWVFMKTHSERRNQAKPASVTKIEGFKVIPPKGDE